MKPSERIKLILSERWGTTVRSRQIEAILQYLDEQDELTATIKK